MDTRNAEVRFGYAEVDITPTGSVELVGFDRPDNMSKGVLNNLIAQIALWDVSGVKLCLIAIDSLGFTVELTNTLRDMVARELSTTRDKVMVCFSHTHAAPNAATEKAYFEALCAKVKNGIQKAVKTHEPVKAAWGIAEADIGVNRRGNHEALDRRIGILKIAGLNSAPKLLLLRVTAHANVLTSDNYLISADYFHTTRAQLEQEYSCKVLLTQGASGDIKPKYRQAEASYLEEHPREASMMATTPHDVKRRYDESMAALNKMAGEISAAVRSVYESIAPQPIYNIDMFSEVHSFAADVPTQERAREIADEAWREAEIEGRNWLLEVDKLHQNGVSTQYDDIEIQYFVLNNGCWCGVANEVMCGIALDICRRTGDSLVYFGGYTNGCGGYLPTADEYDKGGYEVLWSYLIYYPYHQRVMPLSRETATKLAEVVSYTWNSYKRE